MRNLVFIFTLLLSACEFAPQGSAIRAAIKEGGAKVMDESLGNAEWWLCQGASIGSIKRRYGGGKSDAYNELCEQGGKDVIR